MCANAQPRRAPSPVFHEILPHRGRLAEARGRFEQSDRIFGYHREAFFQTIWKIVTFRGEFFPLFVFNGHDVFHP
jgi:hypothetical protein